MIPLNQKTLSHLSRPHSVWTQGRGFGHGPHKGDEPPVSYLLCWGVMSQWGCAGLDCTVLGWALSAWYHSFSHSLLLQLHKHMPLPAAYTAPVTHTHTCVRTHTHIHTNKFICRLLSQWYDKRAFIPYFSLLHLQTIDRHTHKDKQASSSLVSFLLVIRSVKKKFSNLFLSYTHKHTHTQGQTI